MSFGSDVETLRRILTEVAGEVVGDYARFAREAWKEVVDRYRIEDAQVDPMISMSFDENWMNFTLRYVVGYKQRWKTKDELYSGILRAIETSGGRVAVAATTLDLNLKEAPNLGVFVEPRTDQR